MDPLESLLGPFPCARVRGLPYGAAVEDILVFFQGLVVIDVVIVSREESGEAFVLFTNHLDLQVGLQRNHQSMGDRYLEVFQGQRSDYYAAISSVSSDWTLGFIHLSVCNTSLLFCAYLVLTPTPLRITAAAVERCRGAIGH